MHSEEDISRCIKHIVTSVTTFYLDLSNSLTGKSEIKHTLCECMCLQSQEKKHKETKDIVLAAFLKMNAL